MNASSTPRSQFLTLLCVLTFLSCGIGLIDAGISYLNADRAAQTTYNPNANLNPNDSYFENRSAVPDKPLPDNPAQIRQLAVTQFAYSLLTLAGALLMFRQRRIGFWLYVAGVAIGLALPVALAGFRALNTSFGPVFSLVFIVLYWRCRSEWR